MITMDGHRRLGHQSHQAVSDHLTSQPSEWRRHPRSGRVSAAGPAWSTTPAEVGILDADGASLVRYQEFGGLAEG
jgi:hypothetical protein